MVDAPHPLIARLRAWSVPLTAAATLALGWLFLALDISSVLAAPLVLPELAVGLQALLLPVACTVMLAKRRAPLRALAAGTALFAVDLALGGSLGMLLVLIDLLHAATLHTSDRGRRALLLLVAAVAVVGTLLTFALTGDARQAVLAALSLFAVLATPYWWGLAVQRERARAALEAQRADDLAQLAALEQHGAVREERSRMARDLHDAIASELAAIAIHTEAALAAPAPARASLETIRAASLRSLEQMRSMILVLRSGGDPPAAPDRLTDADGILDRARELGLSVTLEGDPPPMPVAVDQAAGRILQESLTNAMKHAPGAPVAVRVARAGDALTLRIDSAMDAAGAFAPPPSAGLGVRMMRERAAALGGDLTAGPDAGGGARWTVRATLPLHA
ncbi:sensor histidine kinase [Agrococcus carbonis]|uniref:histidine kinase n=1 Tax=Agrococcus carbonis TaxID=684552 RepID=A0A1H1PHV8_9MICO|nr:histidine kinase [Agrococcus carbonis]SDS10724.1 Signal transduction histidine kinase [Agrococcus carbonis]